nr:uncharacterized protein LOC106689252 [Halyomorpha halys]
MRTLKPPDKKIFEPVNEFKPVLLYSEDEQVQINIDDSSLLRHQLSDSEIDIFLPASTPVDSSCEVIKNESRLAPRKPTTTKSSSPNRQGPQRCQVCGKVFANASALAKHKLTHSDERRYICTMCAKAFKRQDHLNGHMLTHRNKKPYECKAEGCSKSYCDARSLRRHTENHHAGTGSTNSTPEQSPPTCIQYAPPPNEQKQVKGQNSSEKLTKQHLELIQHVIQKNQHPSPVKSFDTTKTNSATSAVIASTNGTKTWTMQTSQSAAKAMTCSIKPVECNLCHRKFKNIPALNGHMRLHGGYFKKDSDARRYEIKDVNTTPLQTASISVRALIEEKIILKRISKPSGIINVEQGTFTVQNGDEIVAQNVGLLQKSVTVDNPIIKRAPKITLRRSAPDPGMHKTMDGTTTLVDPENGIISLQELTDDTVDTSSFQKTISESVILETVDSSSMGEVPTKIEDIDDITALDDCQSAGECLPSPQSFQHNQELQSVLDSPLPASLADFAYSHSQDTNNELQNDPQNYSPPMVASSSFSYSSPKLSSSHSSLLQNSNPSDFFSPNGISSTSVSSDAVVLTSKSPSPSTSTSNASFQSQMMPNSDDPLLSSSPKEFVSRKRVEFHPLKILQKNTSQGATSQNVTGILLGSNGELRVIHTSPKHGSKLASAASSYPCLKSENGIKIKSISFQPKTTFIKKYEKIGQFISDESKDKADDAVFNTPSLALSPLHLYRKRPRLEFNQYVSQYKSRLRNFKSVQGNKPLSYTPPPMLPPSRPGQGLYWLAVTSTPSSTTLNKGSSWDEGPEAPESDSRPHINIGSEYQAEIQDCVNEKRNLKEKARDHLLWDSSLNKIVSDYEIEKYLEFACCAAVPGGGRNKEHALHLLHICNGIIQDAILKLMQPVSWLPADHPLLTFEYTDSEKWNMIEIDAFHQALLKYDKDFSSVAHEVETKTSKQCVQFYYLWKKVCPEEYKKLRVFRKRFRETEYENESPKLDQQTGDAELVSTTSSEGRLFLCEYQDCSASFNSRAALNGHIRIHVGGTGTRCGTPDKRSPQLVESLEEFPCKICGKVFNKVKSRSAHMKSHRPPDAEVKKQKSDLNKDTGILSLTRTGSVSSSMSTQRNS